MGQRTCGRKAAVLTTIVLGLPPAFGMDRIDRGAIDREAGAGPSLGVYSEAGLAALTCPTRFDYLVLASFADAASLLSLSAYHFRSDVRFSTIPLAGSMRVDYRIESGAGDCRPRGFGHQT